MRRKQTRGFKWLAWFLLLVVASWGVHSAEAKAQKKPSVKKPSTKIAQYDAIVVGAGYGGLIAGAILSKNGLKTLVVEGTEQIGGRLGSAYHKGYALEWGLRDAKDFEDNFVIITERGQYGKKAAEVAGADIAWVGPVNPLVLMHRVADSKVVTLDADTEGSKIFATETLNLPPDKVNKFLSTLKGLAAEDPQKWITVPMKEWLSTVKDRDKAFDEALNWLAIVHLALPLEETSVGRWIQMFRSPQRLYRVDDPKVGGLQGVAESYARVIRKHGGEIKLGLETVEITAEGNRVTGIVARDKINVVQEFQAPVVVFSEPVWEIFKVLDESHFPRDVVENARKLEKGYKGDFWVKNIGVSRAPTIRATGKPDQYIGYNQVLFDFTTGWSIPSLSSKKAAPPGKHVLCLNGTTRVPGSFKSAKADAEALHNYMRKYYSDLDEVTEWENYQWPKVWGTGNTWLPVLRSPLQVSGLDGLYFVGNTVEVDGMFNDISANSALQATQLILQRRGKTISKGGNAMSIQTEENKKLVIEFYNRLFNKKDLTAIDQYIHPNYIQHNPLAADGADGIRAAAGYLFSNFPQLQVDIKRAIAEGDLVVLHVHMRFKPEDRGKAIMEVVRVENGRLVEHWDVGQDVPEKAANPNGMF